MFWLNKGKEIICYFVAQIIWDKETKNEISMG